MLNSFYPLNMKVRVPQVAVRRRWREEFQYIPGGGEESIPDFEHKDSDILQSYLIVIDYSHSSVCKKVTIRRDSIFEDCT